MTDNQKPAQKRRLLIEDADAIVETREGRQQVTKVPDRKAEAEKRGVDESSL